MDEISAVASYKCSIREYSYKIYICIKNLEHHSKYSEFSVLDKAEELFLPAVECTWG